MTGQETASPNPPKATPPDQGAFIKWIRGFLARLIVDVMVEFYARIKTDPVFNQKFTDAFKSLDNAKSQEETDLAAKAIQSLISS